MIKRLADYSDDSSDSGSNPDLDDKKKLKSREKEVRSRSRSLEKRRVEAPVNKPILKKIARSKNLESPSKPSTAGGQQNQWLLKEDEFMKKQLIEQSRIRIEKRREKPIDFLVKILLIYKGDLELTEEVSIENLKYPAQLFTRMRRADVEIIASLCDQYKGIETEQQYLDYWESLKVLSISYINELIKMEQKEKGKVFAQSAINEEYSKEIDKALSGKNCDELELMEKEAQDTLNSNDMIVDVEFWENMLKKILVKKAEIKLLELYTEKYEKKMDPEENTTSRRKGPSTGLRHQMRRSSKSPEIIPKSDNLIKILQIQNEEEYEEKLSKKREEVFESELNFVMTQVKENLEKRRQSEKELSMNGLGGFKRIGVIKEDEKLIQDLMSKNIKEDENKFSLELQNVKNNHDWIDKFTPRKPHYFNRVKMGYEWNNFNQTHYDLDNPPPKEVLGYKFNIFYPHLIDKNTTPSYKLENLESNEFCLIRFSAGPPYEDIAFKIVNKEWDLSDRHGFKCVFDRGILHLYFNFVKVRYRR